MGTETVSLADSSSGYPKRRLRTATSTPGLKRDLRVPGQRYSPTEDVAKVDIDLHRDLMQCCMTSMMN